MKSHKLVPLLGRAYDLANDILDVKADRQHPRKRVRPIASGDLSLPVAAVLGLALILSALCGAVLLNRTFALTLLSYLILTFAYSVFLKRLPLVDVLVVASLFTLQYVGFRHF
jgi:4-hydroxybenzoate polyprenyltransferase